MFKGQAKLQTASVYLCIPSALIARFPRVCPSSSYHVPLPPSVLPLACRNPSALDSVSLPTNLVRDSLMALHWRKHARREWQGSESTYKSFSILFPFNRDLVCLEHCQMKLLRQQMMRRAGRKGCDCNCHSESLGDHVVDTRLREKRHFKNRFSFYLFLNRTGLHLQPLISETHKKRNKGLCMFHRKKTHKYHNENVVGFVFSRLLFVKTQGL